MATKRVSTRIPVFGPRIPVPVAGHLPSPAHLPSQQIQIQQQESRQKPHEISTKDVGRKVRVADKEGTLRFVGNVHFSTGTWCGVELDTSVGKHDGCVRGVRYFSCSDCRGLMAPLVKVSLIDEIAEDAVSGPYSMIFGVNDESLGTKENNKTYDLGGGKALIRSNTFDKADFENIRKTQITCDTTIVNQSDSVDETVINISITNRGRVLNISHGGKEKRDSSPMMTTVIKDKPKLKVPSELNLCCNETIILKHMNDSFERPRSYPITENYFSTPLKSSQNRKSLGLSPIHKCNNTSATTEEDNKRDSLDCDESLGILTPDQMNGVSFMVSRSPSSENIQSLPNDQKFPQNLDSSIKDFSLLDINQLSTFTTMKSDTTMNMELPLDTEKKSLEYIARIEQTPSPEELPLDPTPVVDSEPKTEPSQSKTTSNFITSITSITSIDTGYQGDGEMSRPASRGADNSPLTRRPLPRVQPRRPDPMTDSDFYTESDADNHDDNHPLKGDRKAQVIDGTLYGADPLPHAEIYVNNRENMDSSGIFTDLESNKDEVQNKIELDVSPSDSSTKTISDNSQNDSPKPLNLTSPDSRNVSDCTVKELPLKKIIKSSPAPSSIASSPSSVRSPRRLPKEDVSKKYRAPKRNVPSKVKAALENGFTGKVEAKTPPKKTVGRWDAVMNKISKGQGEQMKNNLKEVKSKVFTGVSANAKVGEVKENQNLVAKQQNNKLRRLRARPNNNITPTKNKTNIENSFNSSLSDLSAASPIKNILGSAKKQRDVVRVTQVLTAAKLSPKPNNRNINNSNEAKKISSPTTIDVKATNKRNLFNSGKEKKKEVAVKECNRTTNKGGRVSPGTRPPQPQRVQVSPAPKTAEALAVLVQHLVFNLEAFRVPYLKKEVDKVRLDAKEARLSYQQIEEKLLEATAKHAAAIEEERARFRSEISALAEKNARTIYQLKNQHEESERKLKEQVQTIAGEYSKLQKAHSESMDILREENDAIREEIDDKNALIDKLQACKHENDKMKKSFKEQLLNMSREVDILKEENGALLSHSRSEGNDSIQEVLSLRAVLDLKQSEIQELRKYVGELSQKADMLQAVEEKVNTLQAKCEDLTSQLDRKNLYELQLLQERKKLEESLKEEANQKRCLVQRNEELQWKLQQNKEVVTKVIEHAEEGIFNRSLLSSSFSERHTPHRYNLERTSSLREKPLLSKSAGDSSRKSKNSYDLDFDDISPPSSPKVKGVVEKSDSVSYVLEMDESPDVVASRIVRRSFRNTTPPKNTPTKSPSNKRPRIKTNPLSLSASASAIMSNSKSRLLSSGDYDNQDVFLWENNGTSTPLSNQETVEESSSTSNARKIDNIDIDEDLRLQIPSLPSEIGTEGKSLLPTPRHLAGEAMIVEISSDDESTTSSSSGQL